MKSKPTNQFVKHFSLYLAYFKEEDNLRKKNLRADQNKKKLVENEIEP